MNGGRGKSPMQTPSLVFPKHAMKWSGDVDPHVPRTCRIAGQLNDAFSRCRQCNASVLYPSCFAMLSSSWIVYGVRSPLSFSSIDRTSKSLLKKARARQRLFWSAHILRQADFILRKRSRENVRSHNYRCHGDATATQRQGSPTLLELRLHTPPWEVYCRTFDAHASQRTITTRSCSDLCFGCGDEHQHGPSRPKLESAWPVLGNSLPLELRLGKHRTRLE